MKKKKKEEKDYRAMFLLGATFVAVGVTFMTTINPGLGAAFMGIGGLFMLSGARHRDKWKKK